MKYKILFYVLPLLIFISCQTVPKDITYFQDLGVNGEKQITHFNSIKNDLRIKNNDVLLITVSSPDPNQELISQFNLPTISYLTPGERVSTPSTTLQTYLVGDEGYINYPVIGKIKLRDLTIAEANKMISEKVSEYIKEPIINITILSFKVTVLGEVLKPGPVVVNTNRISILDAIGAAGDLTIYGNRKNVRLARDSNGVQEVIYIDLTSSELFSSPYFYLQQNDVIIIDPNNTKKRDSKYGQSSTYNLSLISTFFSALTVVASLVTTIVTLTR